MTGLLLFCSVYLLATATPGPGVAALVARALSHDSKGLAPFIAGYVVGDLIWFTIAAAGLAVVAQTAAGAFTAIKYAGAIYLMFLAYRAWTAPVQAKTDAPPAGVSAPGFLTSLFLTLGNPKVIVFFMALLPTVVDLEHLTLPVFAATAACICVILSSVLTAYAVAAIRAKRLLTSTRSLKWVNRASGAVMGGAAIAIAAR